MQTFFHALKSTLVQHARSSKLLEQGGGKGLEGMFLLYTFYLPSKE